MWLTLLGPHCEVSLFRVVDVRPFPFHAHFATIVTTIIWTQIYMHGNKGTAWSYIHTYIHIYACMHTLTHVVDHYMRNKLPVSVLQRTWHSSLDRRRILDFCSVRCLKSLESRRSPLYHWYTIFGGCSSEVASLHMSIMSLPVMPLTLSRGCATNMAAIKKREVNNTFYIATYISDTAAANCLSSLCCDLVHNIIECKQPTLSRQCDTSTLHNTCDPAQVQYNICMIICVYTHCCNSNLSFSFLLYTKQLLEAHLS